MTTSRVPLVVAAIVSGFVLAQTIVGLLLSALEFVLTAGGGTPANFFYVLTEGYLVSRVLPIIAFGVGVFLSLRFVRPIRAELSWRATIVGGVIAALLGTAAVIVVGLATAVLGAANPGTYPFGYSFAPTINVSALPEGIVNALASAVNSLIDWSVPVVLAALLLKIWLARKPATVTVPASPVATRAGR